jgi:hypothetical protein
MASYIDAQFARLEPVSDICRLQIVSDGGKTNWLNISPSQVERIKAILTEEMQE